MSNSVFTRVQVPFAVTLLFAVTGWILQHYVDRLWEAPIVEYEVSTRDKGGGKEVVVTIENLSYRHRFSGLEIILRSKDGQFVDPMIEPEEPAWEGDEKPTSADGSATFKLQSLNPGWMFRLTAEYTGTDPPTIQMHGSRTAIQFVAASGKTWFLRHETGIFLGLLVLWIVVMVIYWMMNG